MWPLSKTSTPLVTKEKEDMRSYFELNNVQDRMAAEVQKSIDLSHFQVGLDYFNEGGHFDEEFHLRASVGRLKGLFIKEPWTYATASLIAKTISTVPFIIRNTQTGEIDEEHPLNDMVNGGDIGEAAQAKKIASAVDLLCGGNIFYALNDERTKNIRVPVEYTNLKLRNVQTSEDKALLETVGPVKYVELYGAPGTNLFNVNQSKLDYKDVVHIKLANPFNPFFGLPLYVAAVRPILTDREMSEFQMAFYKRGATNSGVIETTQDLSTKRMKRLMATYEKTFTGRRNWWRTIFLPKGGKWVNSGATMDQLKHIENKQDNRLTLLAVLGIPPMKLGIVQDVNRSTAEIQDKTYYENTIIPLATTMADGWNNSYYLRIELGGIYKVEPDFSGVEAVEGSIRARGENAQSVDKYLIINEIREDILKYPPLKKTDPRGKMFASEVRPSPSFNPFSENPEPATNPDDLGPEEEVKPEKTPEENEEDNKAQEVSNIKQSIINTQETIEKNQGRKYLKAYDAYIEKLLKQAQFAIINNRNVRGHLEAVFDERLELYMRLANPALISAMDRGFVSGSSNAKSLSMIEFRKFYPKTKQTRFTATDEQAIDILREKTKEDKRRVLENRNIKTFSGFDETRTNVIMNLIDLGLQEGQTLEQIAKTIEDRYFENYSDQAFTIARTEVLTAVSEGLMWNHEVLNQVFSHTGKQWFHVGDVKSNPGAREGHAAFENEGDKGVVPSNFVYTNFKTGGKLSYPRDPMGGAGETVNCRCSLTTVIPPNATSNAQVIIDTES
jgi:HK97 family phage portal protein